MEVLVVGAGAAGLMSAIWAARAGASVTVLEGMEKPGKKLLITGNGRCNLTNRRAMDGRFYHTRNPKTADSVLRAFPASETINFFEELGLLLKDREGELVYPYSDQALSVAEALLREAARLKIKIKCQEKAISVCKEGKTFQVRTEGWQYRTDRLILASGGRAASGTGSDGSGYLLAKSLGHTLVPVLPALVPLTVEGNFGKTLEGVRSRAGIKLFIDGKKADSQLGELQWTSYGVSGIVIFQLSSMAVRARAEGKTVTMEVDLLPDFSVEELKYRLQKHMRTARCTYEELLGGYFHQKVFRALMKKYRQNPGALAVTETALRILKESKGIVLQINGNRPFEQAQVCSGGIPLKEVDPVTLESKRVRGLYFAGELLDVDGPCGGYNLQWAWSSGCVAGSHAGKGDI